MNVVHSKIHLECSTHQVTQNTWIRHWHTRKSVWWMTTTYLTSSKQSSFIFTLWWSHLLVYCFTTYFSSFISWSQFFFSEINTFCVQCDSIYLNTNYFIIKMHMVNWANHFTVRHTWACVRHGVQEMENKTNYPQTRSCHKKGKDPHYEPFVFFYFSRQPSEAFTSYCKFPPPPPFFFFYCRHATQNPAESRCYQNPAAVDRGEKV